MRDLRITVRRVLEILATYPDRATIRQEYPELEDEDIVHALGYAPGWAGIGEDLPKGVFLQWAEWVSSPRYLFDSKLPALENFSPAVAGRLSMLASAIAPRLNWPALFKKFRRSVGAEFANADGGMFAARFARSDHGRRVELEHWRFYSRS